MIYTIEIDATSKASKNLVNLLKDLSKKMKEVKLLETEKDDELLSKMLLSKKSGRASRHDVNKTLKDIMKK